MKDISHGNLLNTAMKSYDHKKIEKKWQKIWEESSTFKTDDASAKEKLYVLDMFPYPSGAGLHVGHVEGYTATDVYSRYKRMRGYNVLHPMGWDAFGLPAENYAIKTGVPPAQTTTESIDAFRAQIKNLGLSYDWSREIGTHTPEYYRWTQWFFLFLFKNGLAEKRMAKVNWCPKDQTVLANEQTVSESGEKGVCVRCGTKVIQKDLEQWFFKITQYADALVDDLDTVDWPESTKVNQRNWIGRSEGAEIDFELNFKKNPTDNDRRGPDGEKAHLTVFTTRPDTLYGATYMVLAPEHLWITLALDEQHDVLVNKEEVRTYVEAAKNKTDLERQEEQKDKTGVRLNGVVAINPATKEEIPIFIADYVLGGYGTGAIMAVPAHDDRDHAFAEKFGLPIRQVIEPTFSQTTEPGKIKEGEPFDHREAIIAIVKHWSEEKYLALRWKQVAWGTFVTGGIEEGQNPEDAARMEIREETGFLNPKFVQDLGVVHGKFYHVPKQTNRNAHAHVVYLELQDGVRTDVAGEERAIHEVLWLTKDELKKFLTPDTHQYGLKRLFGEAGFYTDEGTLSNSGQFSRLESAEAKKRICEAVGGRWVKVYRLRDWLISRQRYWGSPIPVVYDPEGKPHPVPDEHLPWLLPTDVEFKPTGVSPLGQSKELLERTERLFGKGWRPDIDTMDTFVCSSWYFFRFADPHNDEEFASAESIKKWQPVDLYMGGAEHTVLHLMYARFITKVLKEKGYVAFSEPFLKLRHQGTILAEDGSKMSKSKGNVINPDTFVDLYGADTVRMYEMFMGPLEAMKPWNTSSIIGIRRFLERVWRLAMKDDAVLDGAAEILMNQTIKKVGDDIENLKMNTAISSLMILLNEFEKMPVVPQSAYRTLLQLLAPFAPHIASELWAESGATTDLSTETWPVADGSKLKGASTKIAVQINGKTRGEFEIATDADKDALEKAAKEAMAERLKGKVVSRTIIVPNRLINFVIAE